MKASSLRKSVTFTLIVVAMYICFLNLHIPDLQSENAFQNFPFDNFMEMKYSPLNRTRITETIALINEKEEIKNEDIFGTFNNYSAVIAIQVHDRITYLKYLIGSLEHSRSIDTALLVFSHDFFDENINLLVNSIKFCKFIQIFYPYAIQYYPNLFPGDDKYGNDSTDCLEELTQKSRENPCLKVPIRNGQQLPRNAQLVQAKHHWWWKANRLFNLASLREYEGIVLFLEEDHYVLPDFIYVLRLMGTIAEHFCDQCKLFAMADFVDVKHSNQEGYYSVYLYYTILLNIVAITNRFSSVAMAFNRSVWREITKCKYDYCFHDDYNFDFSLRNVFYNCMKEAKFLVLYAGRVFHTGICGLHNKRNHCNAAQQVNKIRNLVRRSQPYLFPKQLILKTSYSEVSPYKHGGWDDSRDHAFCLGMTIT